ncbi:MAG TPA: ATP-binding protein [Rudaea sp.]|nr:ATP-binding protein [Rudaea sp.]
MNDSLFLESERSLLDAVRVDALLDSLPVPVLVTNIDGTSTWPNASARQLDEWLKADDPKRRLETELVPALQMLAVSSEPTPLRLSLHQQRGDTRTYQATFATLPAGGARNELYAIMLAEIAATDTGDAQVRSEIAQARLEDVQRQLLQADRMASIGQLAAGVAHEINNPIGYIQSNLGTLREYVASLFRLIEAQDTALHPLRATGQLREIDDIREQIDFEFLAKDLPTLLAESQEGIARVRKIIQDLREFSRAGHSEDWTLADLHAGLDSTINIVWNDLKYKVELLKRYGDVPPVECLPSQLNQVFLNILVNAGHAIEKHGQIVVATRSDAKTAYVEISDTGKGIAPAHLTRVFEPFFTTKPIGKGTGLGLSISYGIIKKHGGEIDVRSEVGVGTTFLIKLPLRQAHTADTASNGQA